MRIIRPKNWGEFQHYRDRAPAWIKLHKRLLDDYDFQCLPVASRALAPMLWLLASEYDDGDIPGDTRKIAFRLRMTLEELAAAFEPLLKAGFFEIIGEPDQAASEMLAEPERSASPEKRREQVTSNKTEDKKEEARASRAGSAKGTRWPSNAVVPEEWVSEAKEKRREHDLVDIDLRLESLKFCNYWTSRTGVSSTRLNWRLTWINWALRDERPRNGRGTGERGKGIRDAALDALEAIRRAEERDPGQGSGQPPGLADCTTDAGQHRTPSDSGGDHQTSGDPRRGVPVTISHTFRTGTALQDLLRGPEPFDGTTGPPRLRTLPAVRE